MHRNTMKSGKKNAERRQYQAAYQPPKQSYRHQRYQIKKLDLPHEPLAPNVAVTRMPGRMSVLFALLIISGCLIPRIAGQQTNARQVAALVKDRLYHSNSRGDELGITTHVDCPRVVESFTQAVTEFPTSLPRVMSVLSDPELMIGCHRESTAAKEVNLVPGKKIILSEEGVDSRTLLSAIRRAQNYLRHTSSPCRSIGLFAAVAPVYPVNPDTVRDYDCALSAGDQRVLEFKYLQAHQQTLQPEQLTKLTRYQEAAVDCLVSVVDLVDEVQGLLRLKHASATPAAKLAYRESYTIAGLTPVAIHVFYPEVENLMRMDEERCQVSDGYRLSN